MLLFGIEVSEELAFDILVGALLIGALACAAMNVVAVCKGSEKAMRWFVISMLLMMPMMCLLIADRPVPIAEPVTKELLLSNYREHGVNFNYYLKYDPAIKQYKYCCFDDDGALIGLTTKPDSTRVVFVGETDLPYRVELKNIECRTRFTGRHSNQLTQTFYLPDKSSVVQGDNT